MATHVLHHPIIDPDVLRHRALLAIAGVSGFVRVVLFLMLVTMPHD